MTLNSKQSLREEVMKELEAYLKPGIFVNSDHPAVIKFARENTRETDNQTAKAVALYYKIRDTFQYNPYKLDLSREGMKASHLLTRDYGYCIEKANLLAACARTLVIPSRLGFAKVKNHIGANKLKKILKTDILVFHGYTELYLNNKWVKATPAFNKNLCNRLNVTPLGFNGKEDSIFQEYDKKGGKFMDYLHDYGTFSDIPYGLFISELKKHYPHMFEEFERKGERLVIIK
jgi:transglutaminase-like putative cysteine protease